MTHSRQSAYEGGNL